MSPATTSHCTGVGVAPVSVVVSQPVLAKVTTDPVWAMTLSGPDAAVIRQVPVGAAGVAGTGVTEGVHPARVIVSIGVRPESETVTWQSGEENPSARMLNRPCSSARTPAEPVAELAITKI